MLETPHVILGAAIAAKTGNPLLAIPLAFTSHFILEMIPHWNPHINTETKKYGHPTKRSTAIIAVDSTLALASGSFIAYQALPNTGLAITILVSCFAAVLPDLIEAPYFYLKMRSKFLNSWLAFQKSIQSDTTPFWGLISQGLMVAATLLFLYTPLF